MVLKNTLRFFESILKPYLKTSQHRRIIGMYSTLKYGLKNGLFYMARDNDPNLLEFARMFYDYSLQNNLEEKINAISTETDAESVETLRRLFERYSYVMSHNHIPLKEWFFGEDDEKVKRIEEESIKTLKECKTPKYIGPAHDIFYYHCGLRFLPQKIKEYIKDKSFFDCGAFVGESAIVFEKLYSVGTVYSFEPEKTNYETLLKTIELSSLNKTKAVMMGVGAKKETQNLCSDGVSSMVVEDIQKGSSIQKIEITDIDSFVEENNIKKSGSNKNGHRGLRDTCS